MRHPEIRFVVSYDLESEYVYRGVHYRLRVGAHRGCTRPDYYPVVCSQIGTVRFGDTRRAHEFPGLEAIEALTTRRARRVMQDDGTFARYEMTETPAMRLLAARWTPDYSHLEVYDPHPTPSPSQLPQLVDDGSTVWLREWAAYNDETWGSGHLARCFTYVHPSRHEPRLVTLKEAA